MAFFYPLSVFFAELPMQQFFNVVSGVAEKSNHTSLVFFIHCIAAKPERFSRYNVD